MQALPLVFVVLLHVTRRATRADQHEVNDFDRTRMRVKEIFQTVSAETCKPGTSTRIDLQFDKTAFRTEANVALFTANFLSGILDSPFYESQTYRGSIVGSDKAKEDQWIYELARNTVQTHEKVVGSGVCFANGVYRNYEDFCPYARKNKTTGWVDTSYLRYPFSNNRSSEAYWWHVTRQENSRTLVERSKQTEVFVFIRYANGTWTTQCHGGSAWVVTYAAPFLNRKALVGGSTYEFGGAVTVDMSIDNVDVNQCDESNFSNGDSFHGSHLCDRETSVCQHRGNQGFKLGSYLCVCKRGFYADSRSEAWFELGDNVTGYEGSLLEDQYNYSPLVAGQYRCLPCDEGCDECVDDKQCVYHRSPGPKNIALVLNGIGILTALCLGIFVFISRGQRIVSSGIPPLLIVMLTGVVLLFMSSTMRVVEESVTSCLLFRWFFNIGLPLMYGSIELRALYIWRQHQAVAARTKRLRLNTPDLYKSMVSLVVIFIALLTAWSIIAPPFPEEFVENGLKFQRCGFNHISYFYVSFLIHVLLLGFGIYLSCQVYSIPSYFSEGKLIVVSIVNMSVAYTLILVMLIIVTSYNPDSGFLTYAVIVHVICDVPMGLLLGPRVYFIARGKGAMMMTSEAETTFLHTMTVAGYYISDDEFNDSSLRELRGGANGEIDAFDRSPELLKSPVSLITQTTSVSVDENTAECVISVTPTITVTAVADDMENGDEEDNIRNKMQPVSTHTFELFKFSENRRKSIDNVLDMESSNNEKRRKSVDNVLEIESSNNEKRRKSIDMFGVKARGRHGRRKTLGDIHPAHVAPNAYKPGRRISLPKPVLLQHAQPLLAVSPLPVPSILARRQRQHPRFGRRASVAGEVFETIVEFSSTGEKLREETRVKNIYEVLLERRARRGSSIGSSRFASDSTVSTGFGSVSDCPPDCGIDIDKYVNSTANSLESENPLNVDIEKCGGKPFMDEESSVHSYDPEYGTAV